MSAGKTKSLKPTAPATVQGAVDPSTARIQHVNVDHRGLDVRLITEELCGHEFSASTVSRINQGLDEELAKFAERRLEEEYPYVILDARYEKVWEEGVIRSQAMLVAIGINWEDRRCVLHSAHVVELPWRFQSDRRPPGPWHGASGRFGRRGSFVE